MLQQDLWTAFSVKQWRNRTMTQEDKELLIKDLSARLPYMVKVKTLLKEPYTLKGLFDTEYGGVMVCLLGKFVPNNISPKTVNYPLSQIKPYLFPLSSMTDEQKEEYHYIVNYISPDDTDNWAEGEFVYMNQVEQLLHFYHINHLDWRGLIPKGLALDATGLNIY